MNRTDRERLLRGLEAQVCTYALPDGSQRLHLRVWRTTRRDRIGWDALQAAKDEYLGPEVLAVEVFPPADCVVNEADVRHLWEVDALPGVGLGRRGELGQ